MGNAFDKMLILLESLKYMVTLRPFIRLFCVDQLFPQEKRLLSESSQPLKKQQKQNPHHYSSSCRSDVYSHSVVLSLKRSMV